MLKDYLDKSQELAKKNEPFVLAVVVRREEPSSGKAGDKAVINQYGEILGWVGGGCVRAIIIKEAEDAMRTGMPRLVRIGKNLGNEKKHGGVMEYKMTCQSEGMVEVFIEPVLPPPHLVVVGRSAIARALVTEPNVLLLDEPMSALDAATRAALLVEFRDLLAGFAGYRLLVTHEPDDARALADRVVGLDAGRVAWQGPVGDYRP